MLVAGCAASWGAAACVPLNDLDDYTLTPGGAGGGLSPPAFEDQAGTTGAAVDEAPAPSPPPIAAGGASGASGSSGSSGSNDGGGSESSAGAGDDGASFPEAPLSRDAGPTFPPDDGATSACAAVELLGPNGHCYFLDAQAQTFLAARNACQGRGSGWDLAVVRSATESEFLGDALTFEGWLGASDITTEGTWVWLNDGLPFWTGGASGAPVGGAYTNWNATEPNGGTNTSCMRALPRSAGSANPDAPWADLTCLQLRGAICEGPLPP